jgi:hypothetical protein
LEDTTITLRDARLLTDQPDLPSETQYLLLDFDVTAGADTLNTTAWRVELVDAGGQQADSTPSQSRQCRLDKRRIGSTFQLTCYATGNEMVSSLFLAMLRMDIVFMVLLKSVAFVCFDC